MKFNKASMKAHHLQVGQMTQMGGLIEQMTVGPERHAVYSTARYAPPGDQTDNAFAHLLAKHAAAAVCEPQPFLSRCWGFL